MSIIGDSTMVSWWSKTPILDHYLIMVPINPDYVQHPLGGSITLFSSNSPSIVLNAFARLRFITWALVHGPSSWFLILTILMSCSHMCILCLFMIIGLSLSTWPHNFHLFPWHFIWAFLHAQSKFMSCLAYLTWSVQVPSPYLVWFHFVNVIQVHFMPFTLPLVLGPWIFG